MITANNLYKRFKSIEALRGIDLHVKKGEVYGFIGHNGAGKSTAMNILAALSRPSAGQCFVNGKDVSRVLHPSELKIGYLPEDPKFYPWLSAYETLEYLGGKDRAVIDRLLALVGLTDAARRRVSGFSRGMRQRLGIAAALVHDPELLILDEPSSALDPEGRSDVLGLIAELRRIGKTVFFSTHILSDVERVCDTVGMIAEGSMVFEKPLRDIQRGSITPVFDIALAAPCVPDFADALKELDIVTDVKSGGDNLSVTIADADDASPRLMRVFADRGIAVRAFALRERTLEELFIREVNGR